MTINEKHLLQTAVLVASLLVVSSADAAMRCGTQLVYEGDPKEELLDNCGPPDEGDPDMHTEVWIYRMDGAEFEVHVSNDVVERIRGPEMSEDAPPDDEEPPDGSGVERSQSASSPFAGSIRRISPGAWSVSR